MDIEYGADAWITASWIVHSKLKTLALYLNG